MKETTRSENTSPARRRPSTLPPPQEVAERAVFLIGCPRSGTTWLQMLLATDPRIATAPETQIFAYYLNRLRRQWEHEFAGRREKPQGRAGLSRLLSQADFDELCRSSALRVLQRILETQPGASVVLEKSPRHALEGKWISRLLPRSRFLHLIRDPRDTVSSLLAAGHSWGRGWAPRNPVDAARLWKRSVLAGRELAALGDRYYEVRYEDLLENTAGTLRDVMDWLDLPTSEVSLEQAVRACSFSRLVGGTAPPLEVSPGQRSPRGFFRKGRSGAWREDLKRSHARIVERICNREMAELGYDPEFRRTPLSGTRIMAHDSVRRLREALDWKLQQLLDHL